MLFYENQLREQYKLLGHKGYYTQVSCLDTKLGKQLSRELLNGEEEIITWAKEWNGKGNCFLGRAPRTADGDIQFTSCLSLDLDPKRPKGTAATEEQHKEAIRVARNIVKCFGCGIVCSSGNGALILFSLPSPVGKEEAESLGKALEQEAKKFVSNEIEVDHTHDIARLAKMLGTISTKGDKALWRYARFIDDPVRSNDGTYRLLERLKSTSQEAVQDTKLPILSNTIDRSKADYVIALRLKEQGFSPNEAVTALKQYGLKEGREDLYYQRTVANAYGTQPRTGALVQGMSPFMVSGGTSGEELRNIELITPQSGLQEYRSRGATGEPELPTGFSSIDKATFGLIRGTIFCVGARTNVGKTTFAVQVALNLCRTGKRVLFLSTETTYQEIWDRYFACGTDISAFALQHGLRLNGHQQDLDRFIEAEFSRHQFLVYDGSRPNIGILRTLIEQASPDVLVFDYFQHVENKDTKTLEEFVMNAKDLAKEKNFAVLMCAQLHDGAIDPKTQKLYPPTLNSIKNCKALNDESRVVILLDWNRDGAQGDGPQAVKAILAKNKGPRIDSLLKLDRTIPKFVEEA